jgi:hypothetical protein
MGVGLRVKTLVLGHMVPAPTRLAGALTSTNALGRLRAEAGELWQPRCFDHALRTVRDHWEKVEYIHLNPVRGPDLVECRRILWSLTGEQRRRCGLVIDWVGLAAGGQDPHLTGLARV